MNILILTQSSLKFSLIVLPVFEPRGIVQEIPWRKYRVYLAILRSDEFVGVRA
jgi:hypothetical protein